MTVTPNPHTVTIAVIGHVNHGKTALVRALTGMETDRLEEEIRRGLSITLGFAFRDYPGVTVDLIDAPGHADFIRAMVAGATGARGVLLVVSGVEGVAPQTREHVRIAGLLGIASGLVVVTQVDRLSADARAAARSAIQAALADTVLAGQPMVMASSVTGEGLETVTTGLEALARRCPAPEPLAGAFLAIDRAFAVAGAGAVVTGTLLGAPLTVGGEAVLQPTGRPVGLRRIQVHGRDVAVATPGGRMAASLRGVPAREVKAGEVLCTAGAFTASGQVDVQVTLSAEAVRPLRHMDPVRVIWGARQDMASVRVIGAGAIAPGEGGLARLRFASPVIAFAGQRGILRRPSPAETLGGLVVLDPEAPVPRGRLATRSPVLEAASTGDPSAIAGALVARDGGLLTLAEAARLSRLPATVLRGRLSDAFAVLDAATLVMKPAVMAARRAYLAALDEGHRQAPARSTLNAAVIRDRLATTTARALIGHVEHELAARGEIRLVGREVALVGHDPFAALSPAGRERLVRLESALLDGGLSPPDAGGLAGEDERDGDLLALLIEAGRAVSLRNIALRQTLVFHADALDAGHRRLRANFPHPAWFTTGEARAALATSRKFIVPVLEHFDARGLTVRAGDVRQVRAPTADHASADIA